MNLTLFLIIGILFVSILGTLNHFVYKWSKNNIFLQGFVATNESVFEHLKLAFFPTIIFFLVTSFFVDFNNVLIGLLITLIMQMIVIVVGYYLFKFIVKKESLIFDIILFYIAIIIGFLTPVFVYNLDAFNLLNILSEIITTLIAMIIIIFSYFPLNNKFFKPEN